MKAQAEPKRSAAIAPLPEAVKAFFDELRTNTDGDIRSDYYNRILYSTDASIYQMIPFGVVLPKNKEELHAAVELAARHRIPLLPRAGGSSLAGQCVNEAVVLDLSRYMDKVLEVNPEEKTVRVEPGVVLDHLNNSLRAHNLQFGPDPASSNRAAMGGIIANNSTGSHSIRYGMAVDHLLETEVILSDGSIARFGPLDEDQLRAKRKADGYEGSIYRGILALLGDERNLETIRAKTPKHWRRSGGYNLDRLVRRGMNFRTPPDSRFNLSYLLCGSEGTLGVMSELKLNLVPTPPGTGLAIVQFNSTYEALSSVPTILETDPSAVELLDNSSITLCRAAPEYARMLETFIDGNPNCVLITEYYGDSEKELQGKIDSLRSHLKSGGVPATGVFPAIPKAQQSNVWAVRKAGLGLLMSTRGDEKAIAFIEDAAVPVAHLADYIQKIETFCAELDTRVSYYAHASAGCLHVRPLLNAKDAKDVAKIPEISKFSLELLSQYDGALSSEHGAGRSRSWLNERFFGPKLYALFRNVKHTFDPFDIMNPGNIVDAQPVTSNLRYGGEYKTYDEPERISFRSDHGFAGAVEMCNGAGICRKLDSGTMCPSFMVTREEEHSTRGRANALRAALSGKLPHSELTSRRMYEVMDLCIECKGCKSECPSSVDMAKIKFEFLARYQEKHGVSLRTRMMTNIAQASRLSSGPQAALVNGILNNAFAKSLLQRFLGISAKRSLPQFAKVPFTKWFKIRERRTGERGQVVLFNDTFNTYNYPEVSIAAVEVLEALGFEVLLPGHRCCGRPLISKGLVAQARAAALQTVEKLTPFAEQGIPIVGLEPSCLLTLRDEFLYLLPDDPRTERIAELAFTFEEFIAKQEKEGALAKIPKNTGVKALLHGHCHQKALSGTDASHVLLAAAGFDVKEVNSSCCGMAGSFGYEAEHYDISIKMGERSLFPAVRNAEKETVMVAAGVSCRQQIKHGTGKQALHPAQVLRDALKHKYQ